MERTLLMVKPDAVQRGLIGPILTRLERRGLRMVGLKMIQMELSQAQELYAIHQGQRFYAGLIDYITSCPVVLSVWEGKEAVTVVRRTMGATSPAEAGQGTIRGDWSLEIGRNLVHGSDSLENAQREISLFFASQELLDYSRAIDPWVFE